MREPFLARLFFADRLPVDEIRKLVRARRRETGELLAALEAIAVPEPSGDLGQVLRLATLANGVAHARAELDWLDTVERQLDRTGR
ncbi:hypothetical protein ACFQYP_13900 [Nonomuraea antimicrobica]